MTGVIKFSGSYSDYGFLSNFYPAPFIYKNWFCHTSEHAYQAEKTLVPAQQSMILVASSPGKAKKFGRKVTLRPDWEQVKEQVMLDICLQKFLQNPDIADMLVATGDAILVEHTPWGDYYWGDGGDGTGKNRLGFILQAVRSALSGQREV